MVAFDAFAVSSSTFAGSGVAATWTHTCGAGASALYVGVNIGNADADSGHTVTATYNGISMTALSPGQSVSATVLTGASGFVKVFRLANPPTGSAFTISVSASGTTSALGGVSISVTGGGAEGTLSPSFNANTTTGSPTVTGTTVGGLCLAFVAFGSGGMTWSAGTERAEADQNNSSGAGNVSGATLASPGGTATFTFTYPLDSFGVIAFEVLSAASSPPTRPMIPPGRRSPATLGRMAPRPSADAPAGGASAIGVADAAGAIDALAVSAAAPLGDVAGATEALSAAAAVPVADVTGAIDSLSVTVSAPLADAAGAVESSTATVTASLADVAGAADAPVVSAALAVADVAAAIDTVAVSQPIPQADVAAAIDALAVTSSAPLADVAGAVEILSVSTAENFTDAAGAVDTISVALQAAYADAAGAVDTLAATAAVALPEQAGAVDALAAAAAVPLLEVTGAADTIAVVVGNVVAWPETGAAVDSLAVTASAALSDVAGAAEALTVTSSAGLADVAGVTDSLVVVTGTAVPLADAAGAVDALQVAVSVPLGDSAAAVELLAPVVTLAFSDLAGTVEFFHAFTGVVLPPREVWQLQSEVRWRAGPLAARWGAQPETGRWRAEMSHARWAAQPEPARWRIKMTAFDPIAALSEENIPIRWTSDLDGTVIDPTALVCQYALPVSSGNPASPAQPVTWFTGTWLTGGTGKGFVQLCPTGPGSTGPTLVVGQRYDVWGFIQGTPEAPKKYAGTVTVY